MKAEEFKALKKRVKKNRYLYLFLVIPVLYYIIFSYVPMYGISIAFMDFRIGLGFSGSNWVGLQHFERLFTSAAFYSILRNTILLNVYSLVFGFPAPIILALLLNEVRRLTVKRIAQSILYLPRFISWVVLAGIFISMMSPSTGIVNTIMKGFGLEPIFFMANSSWWPTMYVISGIWASAGWSSIIYLAAISNIDVELYEAARIDGAGKFGQIWHITLPCIRGTVAIMLILAMGGMLSMSFDHIYNLQNPAVFDVADVFATYVYRIGILQAQYSYTTAVGLFQSVVSLILIIATNKIVKALGETSLW